ncbi:MAG: hypothetical protein P1Q69_20370, partial [Candidatus Thorarchaeota archaeon]|nr:hypothetical protein [Candidatus Thorarchaeota archaeon]
FSTAQMQTASGNFIMAEITMDSPPDLIFENGSLGEQVVWNATSPNPKNYTILLDGEVHLSGGWAGDVITLNLNHIYPDNLTYILPVTFVYECIIFNYDNETLRDTVEVEVIADVLAPIIVASEDLTYEVGSFGHELDWNITETNPQFYNLTRQSNETSSNDTILESGDWNGNNISISVDGLNASRWYIYTLFVNDTLGYNSTSSINVTVFEDLSAPVISSPDDLTYEFGATGNEIIWFTFDSNPVNYSLEVIVHYNDTTYGNASNIVGAPANITDEPWSFTDPEGLNLTFVVDKMYLGNYTFTLTLFDDYNHNATDSVNVSIYKDLRAPVVTALEEFTYEEGYSGYSLNWSAEENNPTSYNLTRDGQVLMNGTWRGENLTISIDRLAVGEYTFNMTLMDYFNQSTIVLTVVTVAPDAHLPIVQEVSVIASYTTASSNNITVQAYAWDLNNITSITIEWYVGDASATEDMDMTPENNDFYIAALGEFNHGDIVTYRVTAVDNSSVNNSYTTEWFAFTVSAQSSTPLSPIVWGVVLALGIISSMALLWIYFRTKTR